MIDEAGKKESKFQLHPVITEHLLRIGVTDQETLERYLAPSMQDLPPPWGLKDIEPAVRLIIEAITAHQAILVWGDYDVDGISATALVMLFFRSIGYEQLFYHIPSRLTEGYGLNLQSIEVFHQKLGNTVLLLSVDCGIANLAEISYAKKIGWKVVITDHHLVPEFSVPADAIVNPQQNDCQFPAKAISGAAVAFYLVAAVRSKLSKNRHLNKAFNCTVNLKQFLALVALGTIADVMPLDGVNRILVKAGFEAIAAAKIYGIDRLLSELDINQATIEAENIAFTVAPTINAAGRLGQPEVALKALIQEQHIGDIGIFKNLIKLNKKRKKISQGDYEQARQLVEPIVDGKRAIVIQGAFHDGILGITASRLSEEYHVPAIVFTINQANTDQLKGSARAPDGFDLYRTLQRCAHYLTRFGGHQAAAGMSLAKTNFLLFRQFFYEQAEYEFERNQKNQVQKDFSAIRLSLDEALNPLLLKNLLQLEPTGAGNPKPVFYDTDVSFVTLKRFGKDLGHVRGIIRGTYQNVPFVGFNIKKRNQFENDTPVYRLRYTHMFDQYNGANAWKIRALDIW